MLYTIKLGYVEPVITHKWEDGKWWSGSYRKEYDKDGRLEFTSEVVWHGYVYWDHQKDKEPWWKFW
ncbi:MAG: hypothetical protein ABUJ92_00775 [Desulfobacterales bacterium]